MLPDLLSHRLHPDAEQRLCHSIMPSAETGIQLPEVSAPRQETAKDFCGTPNMLNDFSVGKIVNKGVEAANGFSLGAAGSLQRAAEFCNPFGVGIGNENPARSLPGITGPFGGAPKEGAARAPNAAARQDPYPSDLIPTPQEVSSAIPSAAPDAFGIVDALTPDASAIDNGTGKSIGGAAEGVLGSVMPMST